MPTECVVLWMEKPSAERSVLTLNNNSLDPLCVGSDLFVPPPQDKYLHTNCLAALANMSAQFRCLHQYAAQRIIR